MKKSKQYWKLSSTANCHKYIRMRIDYEQSLFWREKRGQQSRMWSFCLARFTLRTKEKGRLFVVYAHANVLATISGTA